jgi:hypothetical protein
MATNVFVQRVISPSKITKNCTKTEQMNLQPNMSRNFVWKPMNGAFFFRVYPQVGLFSSKTEKIITIKLQMSSFAVAG